MTDLNKTIMEKASGGARFNPDEQRKFLGTFEERVICYCSIEEAKHSDISQHFKKILAAVTENYSPVTVKISPELDNSQQVFYLKAAKDIGCEAAIVSGSCQQSPFGLVIHSNQPVKTEEKEMSKLFAQLLNPSQHKDNKGKKTSFWEKLFG